MLRLPPFIASLTRKAQSHMNIKLSDLTIVGWLLALFTIAVTGYVGISLFDGLPAGRYPAGGLIAVVAVVGVAVFMLCAAVLRRIGLPVSRPKPEIATSPMAEARDRLRDPVE